MTKKDKVILYGAGFYCMKFFEAGCDTRFDVIGICDSNAEKWGKSVYGYSIQSLESIMQLEFDMMIITVGDKHPVADVLMRNGVPVSKIFYFALTGAKIIPYKNEYVDIIEKRFFRKNAVQQVKRGLLLESLYEGQYEGYNRAVVLGTDDDVLFIKDFFETVGNGLEVVSKTNVRDITEKDKLLLTDEDYRKNILIIKEMAHVSNTQWIVIPLFDVANSF